METYTETEVRKVERTWDFKCCDTCKKIIDMNTHINGRDKLYRHGAAHKDHKRVHFFTVHDYTYPDADTCHYCEECIKSALEPFGIWQSNMRLEIECELGIIFPGEIIRMAREEAETEATAKREAEEDKQRTLAAIENGTHPIIVAEEEMLQRLTGEKHEEDI